MRQVPHYIVIGDGRLATHMCYYFDSLSIQYRSWHRTSGLNHLEFLLGKATHALILITDSQIDCFIRRNILPKYNHLTIVHFSGALVLDNAYSAHPLQTFIGKEPYSIDEYKRIPFVLEVGSLPFESLLPGLDNPHHFINRNEKPYYHAMCVLANNVTTLLWRKCFTEMQDRFGIEPEHLAPFLERTFINIKHTNGKSISGPIARGDIGTLERNLDALKDDAFCGVLEAVVKQLNHRKKQ